MKLGLIREIEHRVADDLDTKKTSPGSLGSKAEPFLNLMREDESPETLEDKQATFRKKMYFFLHAKPFF